ncbi:MAG TPA: polyprenyl synthetase family protein [Bryobacteraceae bacterium]|nr:polyprenyl synthetase family protein [Bryobacteraceae bacterium]
MPADFSRVLSRIHEIASRAAVDESQRAALRSAIDIQANRLSRRESHISFRMPLTVYAAITGADEGALDIAAAMVLFYMGTDLLDDLADGDPAPEWASEPPSQSMMMAIGMFATLPQIALSQVEAPASVVLELQKALLKASVRMASGQRRDIASREAASSEINLQSAWDCIEAKSGAAIGLLGELPAILADRRELIEPYFQFGSAIGSAFCLMKDCRNLMDGAQSGDLANGTRSYPIALHMSGLRGEAAKGEFELLLQQARTDPQRRDEVRGRLLGAGTFQIAWLVIDSCRQRARSALEKAQPLEPAGAALRAMLDFPSQREAKA